MTRLSLLSGGEKALGAIAFLFSLFLARPSPFYLLDEVEAALDDTNIGRFTELLRTYADRAQFIVITHQKRTMEAADVLYGVTMGAGRRLADRLPTPAARRGRRHGVNDLDFVVRTVDLLWSHGVKTWVFGTWGEELRRPRPAAASTRSSSCSIPPRTGSGSTSWSSTGSPPTGDRWQRAFELEGTKVELLLVERGDAGWTTSRPRRRHEWPDDVFAANGRIPLASPAALTGYPRRARTAA